MIRISVADLIIELDNRYGYVKDLARDYITESVGESHLTVSASDTDIRLEAEASDIPHSPGYLESIVLYREIAERLPRFDAFVFHGAVIALDGAAYAVTARSGVGKTTHLRLWMKAFGDRVHILNGDKPILRIIDGRVYACGTPWRGKENYGVPEMLPLEGIAFLERGEENSARRITVGEGLIRFVSQIYVPRMPSSASMALSVANRIISSVPLYELRANMDISAATVAYDAFTKKTN
ncbi:MAG: hypothetical protein E7617_00425 [Ruminococcaceae bacterium]|nr:hypothetical protein [Oscillospiraceae bacterium]